MSGSSTTGKVLGASTVSGTVLPFTGSHSVAMYAVMAAALGVGLVLISKLVAFTVKKSLS